jgi:hypothetical protein
MLALTMALAHCQAYHCAVIQAPVTWRSFKLKLETILVNWQSRWVLTLWAATV